MGAARSGTTSLHAYLDQHPEVFMSDPKEPRFLDYMEGEQPPRDHPHREFLRRTSVTSLEEYEALFEAAGDAKAIGEASPSYLRNPVVPERAHRLLPEARIVAILRDPVDRAYTAWLGGKRDGIGGPPTFEGGLRDEEAKRGWGKFQGYVAFGMYHRLLSLWYAVYPRERIRVYLYEDLRDDAPGLLRDLFGFLGADPSFVPDTSFRRGRTGRVRNPVLRAVWERAEPYRHVLRPAVPEALRDRVYDRVTRNLVQPPMREDTRAMLRERFRPEVLALQDLIGRDLSNWLDG